jgi:toxin HigB-1
VKHRGLRRLITQDDPRGVPQAFIVKITSILSFLQDASDIAALRTVPTWRVHQLTGDRKGTWSVTVTRNWRITFQVNQASEVVDLDFEDYH